MILFRLVVGYVFLYNSLWMVHILSQKAIVDRTHLVLTVLSLTAWRALTLYRRRQRRLADEALWNSVYGRERTAALKRHLDLTTP
jgi:hypothetical protein